MTHGVGGSDIVFLYIHGFLGQHDSPLGDQLDLLCRHQGYRLERLRWKGGSWGELIGRPAVGVVMGLLEAWLDPSHARSIGRIVVNALQGSKTWDNALQQTAVAALSLQAHVKQLAEAHQRVAIIAFSLGARVVCNFLAIAADPTILQNIHSITLCGAAVDHSHTPALQQLRLVQPGFRLQNLYSETDRVLNWLYPLGTAWSVAAGKVGFQDTEAVVNVHMSVGHSAYDTIAAQVFQCALRAGII